MKRYSWLLLGLASASLAEPPHERAAIMPWLPGSGLEEPTKLTRSGPFVSVQVNVSATGNNIVGDAANEPSLWVDPTNPDRMAIGWRQFDTISSDFRQAGYAYTTDGGSTWTNGGVLEAGVFRSDPVLFGDNQGNVFYSSLYITPGYRTDLWKSTNGGQTFTNQGLAFGGDKQWLVWDWHSGNAEGVIHQVWDYASDYAPNTFDRSFNHGSGWVNLQSMPLAPIWGTIDLDREGRLYIAGGQANNSGTFQFLRMANAPFAAQTPVFDRQRTLSLGGGVLRISTPVINPQGLAGQVNTVVDKSLGPTRGNVYIGCSVYRSSGTNPVDFMVTRSTDGGNTWSTPQRIHHDPVNQTKYHWMGALACAPSGRLDALWFDTRESANNSQSRLYFMSSFDGGVTWNTEQPVGAAFSQTAGWPVQQKLGDYFHPIAFNTATRVAYAATYTGGQDVYFLNIEAPSLPITGRVTLSDFVGSVAAEQPDYEVRFNDNVLQSGSLTLNASGDFNLAATDFITGSYDFWIKGRTWLAKRVTRTVNNAGLTGLNVTLINGDVDGDNEVGPGDFSLLSSSFGSVPGDPGWVRNADLDGDLEVGPSDVGVLSNNFGITGD